MFFYLTYSVKYNLLLTAIVSIFLFLSCTNSNIKVEESILNATKSDTTLTLKKDSFQILLSGMIPPPIYSNALDLVGNLYNIKFNYAAGCIVEDSIGQRISNSNKKTFADLKNYYKRDFENTLYQQVDAESAYLYKLDSAIRHPLTLKGIYKISDETIYYVKNKQNYNAYFISMLNDKKTSAYKIKLILKLDSAKKTILKTAIKDSLITNNWTALKKLNPYD
ncbi:MAG: hypothetical protein SFY56_10525 [Bacteroidota bacterium]|nr:hypothetical protein [Bacteroidota bacterium]